MGPDITMKLDALWRNMPDGEEFVLMLDIWSRYHLLENRKAWARDLTMNGSNITWRGMPIEVHYPMPKPLAESSPDNAEIIDAYPTLVAFRYTKPNGRIAYLDDSANSIEFL